ncbi:MAG: hypothetical protein KBF56_13370, partial [Gemmatimonadaceae bacterium]|nr:hypothetical protein [Gemmatimonadaceae bacterium]
MTPHTRFPQRARAILAGALVAGSFLAPLVRRLAAPLAAQTPAADDLDRREVRITTRDGAKLFTVVV